ncbi:MAG: hypothetical protein CO106_04925 [Deltaproteobacteria bacterium CG_4_9_14_3_um_filter_44_9]|nr:MAG: hypothetical protein AUK23_08035 [Deltaproteobacteria bacterium CG2_30_43_15]PIU86099.1 MAG: hypothetical protein COS67_04285 [Deltaproteobacteria bacterium CG06_land_8_20_14_3_00_44_19]PIX24725.1 MAG: hypothetical protein COZ68_05770 [Deltaproteobacteria bacterium CG_4_8_14_3_um_filter_43_13]PIZ19381.1 MAG: hypothetical protein COY50_10295 [Deltaproteobacteria bacterium CG_4_10_14_0_8_um_filter_43_12]PJB43161.1 MAG: hypothetical protein CO106_04925 [Deltaproteobacteria bacterium CG_4_9
MAINIINRNNVPKGSPKGFFVFLSCFLRSNITNHVPQMLANAAVEQCPKGICLELLVLPAAEWGILCYTYEN